MSWSDNRVPQNPRVNHYVHFFSLLNGREIAHEHQHWRSWFGPRLSTSWFSWLKQYSNPQTTIHHVHYFFGEKRPFKSHAVAPWKVPCTLQRPGCDSSDLGAVKQHIRGYDQQDWAYLKNIRCCLVFFGIQNLHPKCFLDFLGDATTVTYK